MDTNQQIQNQYFNFYRDNLEKTAQAIQKGKVLIFVGMNSIGKTLLINQITSSRFKQEYLSNQKVQTVFLEYKDKNPPTPAQLYKYWLTETAKIRGYNLPLNEEFNDYSFYYHLTEMTKNLGEEKLVYILQDTQKLLDQGEAFFRSLIYLHRFTYGKVSYLVFSEPQILDCKNTWVQRFVQDLTNHKFIFLKLLDKATTITDIQREEQFLKADLKHRWPLVIKYSGGLHGVIGALCYFLKKFPEVKDIRQLRKIVEDDKMCEYWFKDIFDSLPLESLRILKEVVMHKDNWKKYNREIFGEYLVNLGFLKNDGTFRHPLMLLSLKKYVIGERKNIQELTLVKNAFFLNGAKIKLTKREFAVLQVLHKNKGKTVTTDQLAEALWKDNPEAFSLWAIAQTVRRLRKKLAFYFIPPQTIKSIRGEGYMMS